MNLRSDAGKYLLIFLALILAVSIPVYAINYALNKYHLTASIVSQSSPLITPTLLPTWRIETPQLDFQNPTATITTTPITPHSTSTSSMPIPDTGSGNPYIIEVVHIENGEQTLIKIRFPEMLDGQYYAKITTDWSELDYSCLIIGESQQNLFCIGDLLRPYSSAVIHVFRFEEESESSTQIFSGFFDGPPLLLPPSETPTSAPTLTPSSTPTNTDTPTPAVTNTLTPSPTNTPKPTNTSRPTKTPRPTHTPRPTKPPK